MIYTIVLNSTNYQSIATAGNRGNISYAIDWSFLPQGKKYKVSFTFNSKKGTFTADNALQLYVDFTGSPYTYEAGSMIQQKNSNFLGLLYPVMITTTTDVHFVATAHDNNHILIGDRPNNNIVTVRILDNTGSSYNLGVDYILVLSLEEVQGRGIGILEN